MPLFAIDYISTAIIHAKDEIEAQYIATKKKTYILLECDTIVTPASKIITKDDLPYGFDYEDGIAFSENKIVLIKDILG